MKERALLASGCFWSKEYYFSRLPGVVATRVGFTGGHTEHPTYQQVCTKTTGHAEIVEVTFDPRQLSFPELLRVFFARHNPTIDRTGKGGQYRSAIFYTTEAQRATAQAMIDHLRRNGYAVRTQLEPAGAFYPADARHQQYCEVRGIVPREYEGVPEAVWKSEVGSGKSEGLNYSAR